MAKGLPLPDPNQPRYAAFYREVEDYLAKRYGPHKQWTLPDLMKIAQNMLGAGVPPQPPPPDRQQREMLLKQYEALKAAARIMNPSRHYGLIGSGIVPTDFSGDTPTPKAPPALIAGPIIAWRLWKIRQDGILLSVAQAVAWPTGTPLEGIFEGGNYAGAGSRVGPGSTAGIYAMKTREHLRGQEYGRDCLVGQVALWGKVIEHEKGYRAEFAYPVMVDLEVKSPMPGFPRPKRRSELARMIRENYGCEVRE